jgi:hypothetical protein
MSNNGVEPSGLQHGYSGQRTRGEPFTAARTVQSGRRFKKLLAAILLFGVAWLLFQAASIGNPRMVDHSGLIAESQFRFGTERGPANGDSSGVVVSPPGWDLSIAWDAYPCQTAPTVRVGRGDTAGLIFIITAGETRVAAVTLCKPSMRSTFERSSSWIPADVVVDVIDTTE